MGIDRMGISRPDSDAITDDERYDSIYLVNRRHNEVNIYGLFEKDVPKLPLITNAAKGSIAECDDTGNRYRLTKNGWIRIASGNTGEPSDLDYGTFAVAVSRKGVNEDEVP